MLCLSYLLLEFIKRYWELDVFWFLATNYFSIISHQLKTIWVINHEHRVFIFHSYIYKSTWTSMIYFVIYNYTYEYIQIVISNHTHEYYENLCINQFIDTYIARCELLVGGKTLYLCCLLYTVACDINLSIHFYILT